MNTPVTFDRSYDARIEDLWYLWTTREGFASWWGPVGFRVDVHALDVRPGGAIDYDMVAVGEEQIAAMKASGNAVSHPTRGRFVEVVKHERLVLQHTIDFLPGVAAYEHRMRVEFSRVGDRARMVIHVDPHFSEQITRMAEAGMESQLTKLPPILAARRRAAG